MVFLSSTVKAKRAITLKLSGQFTKGFRSIARICSGHKQVAGSRCETHIEVWLLRLMSKSSSRAYTECQVSHFNSILFRHSISPHCTHDNEEKQ